jgi:predicted alpha/beta-hydrolase family hydrolase
MEADSSRNCFSGSERALLRLLAWLVTADGLISAQELELSQRLVARLLLAHDQLGDPVQLAAQLVQTTPASAELDGLVSQLRSDHERRLVASLGRRLLHDSSSERQERCVEPASHHALEQLMSLLPTEHHGEDYAAALFAHPLHLRHGPALLQALPESLVRLQSDGQLQLITPPGFCPFRLHWQTPIGPMPANFGELGLMGQTRRHAFYAYAPQGKAPQSGLLLFPGGSVDFRSYALVARDLARHGFVVVVQHVPFGFALFDHDRAIGPSGMLRRTFPDVRDWVVGGHSLGGVAAAFYANRRPEDVSGLVLWGSYPSPMHSLAESQLPVASLYGSHDGLVPPAQVEETRHLLPEYAQLLPLNGANHTQFGDYWDGSDDAFLQRGDLPASLARQEQRQLIVEHTRQFLQTVCGSSVP